MKPVRLLVISLIVVLACSCSKNTTDDPLPEPEPPAKKVYLKKAISHIDGNSFYRLFEYDGQDRLVKVIGDSLTKPGYTDIEFFYDAQNRLIRSIDYGNADGPDKFQETRRYYYDAAGNCIGDSAFDNNDKPTGFWDNRHVYDAQNRHVSTTTAKGTVIRFEYPAGNNPLNQFIKFFGLADLNIIKYDSFDNKKCWLGDSKTVRLYYLIYGGKYQQYFFVNNPVRYKEAISINASSVLAYADMEEEYVYNAEGYPVSRRVIENYQGTKRTILEYQFEYIIK